MSAETIDWLENNILVGNTSKHGNAWHYRAGATNHYEGPLPVERVISLIDIPLAEFAVTGTRVTEDGVQTIEMPDRKLIARTDTGVGFGIFKLGYAIHGYDEWLRQGLETITDGGLELVNAGLLKKGAVAFLQGELSDTREAAEGIKHRPHVTAATSCDGSLATTFIVGTQIIVCDNTLAAGLKHADSKVKVRHSANSLNRVGDVRNALGLAVEEAGDAFDEEVRQLTSEFVSDERWNEFVKAYTNVENASEGRSKTMAETKVGILNTLWNSDERVAPWKNNAYGVLSAVNTAMHHEFSVKGMERVERNMLRTVTDEWATIDADTLALLAKV